jgi:hypothetical protein
VSPAASVPRTGSTASRQPRTIGAAEDLGIDRHPRKEDVLVNVGHRVISSANDLAVDHRDDKND